MPTIPPETRNSLILRLRNVDDLAAWDEFEKLYGPVIYRVARRRGFQNADAENLVQEVLCVVAQSIAKWIERKDRGRFRAWMLRIARNESINILSRPATRMLGHDGPQGERLLDAVSVRNEISSMIEIEYERSVFSLAARHVQQSVSTETWSAFVLTEVEGNSVEQVARKLGKSKGHVYVSRSRILSRIKKFVQEYEAEHE
ncbi:MAG: sigma-70 family RNA polymerase sigma factor [Planctomycetota bacterium]